MEELSFGKPWDRNNLIAGMLTNNEHAVADLMEVRLDGLSAGDTNVIKVKSFYDKEDKGNFKTKPYRKSMTVLGEIESIEMRAKDGMGTKRATIKIKGSEGEMDCVEVKDVLTHKEDHSVFSNDTFFKPVYWIELKKEMVDTAQERILGMGEHITLIVYEYKENDMQRLDGRYTKLKSHMENNSLELLYDEISVNKVYVMSEPMENLSKTKESGGYGEGIPQMPGLPDSVPVRKPSNGGDSVEQGEKYSSLGSSWWGSND